MNNSEGSFAVRAYAVLLHVIDEGFHQRGRGSNWIPGHYSNARKHATQRGGGVAVDDDFARRLVHALQAIGILLGQRRGCVVKTGLHRGQVQVCRFDLLGKLLADGLLYLGHFDPQQLGHHAHIDHVPDQLAELSLGTHGRDQLVVRNGIKDQIITQGAQVQRLVINNHRARLKRFDIFLSGFRIHRHQEIDFLFACDVAIFAGPNGVPGG